MKSTARDKEDREERKREEGDKERKDPLADSAPWTALEQDSAAVRNKLYPQTEKPKALLNKP